MVASYPHIPCDNCPQARGGDKYNKQVFTVLLVSTIFLGAAIIIVCMVIIIFGFGSWKKNAYFFPEQACPPQQPRGATNHDELVTSKPSPVVGQSGPLQGRSSVNNMQKMQHIKRIQKGQNDWKAMRKTLVTQALMYIAAFVLTWFFPIIRMLLNSIGQKRTRFVDIMHLVLFPLQGFFNALIFVSHKVHNIKRLDTSISCCKALIIIFIHPKDLPEVAISGISLVQQQQEGERISSGSREDKSQAESINYGEIDAASIAAEVSLMFDLSVLGSSSQKQCSMISSNHVASNDDESPKGDDEIIQQQDLDLSSPTSYISYIDNNEVSINDDDSTVVVSPRRSLQR